MKADLFKLLRKLKRLTSRDFWYAVMLRIGVVHQMTRMNNDIAENWRSYRKCLRIFGIFDFLSSPVEKHLKFSVTTIAIQSHPSIKSPKSSMKATKSSQFKLIPTISLRSHLRTPLELEHFAKTIQISHYNRNIKIMYLGLQQTWLSTFFWFSAIQLHRVEKKVSLICAYIIIFQCFFQIVLLSCQLP